MEPETGFLGELAPQLLKPNSGRIICTQIRRATTRSVWSSTCDIWGVKRESDTYIGYRHGTERSKKWDQKQTKVLFVTGGIIMRQVLSHDDKASPNAILDDCQVLMLDEAHASSTDLELILARVLPRLKTVKNLRLVLMSAIMNPEKNRSLSLRTVSSETSVRVNSTVHNYSRLVNTRWHLA